jgi:hypothetical protein
MRVRNWQDIVKDVVDSGVDPEGWRATGGDRVNAQNSSAVDRGSPDTDA